MGRRVDSRRLDDGHSEPASELDRLSNTAIDYVERQVKRRGGELRGAVLILHATGFEPNGSLQARCVGEDERSADERAFDYLVSAAQSYAEISGVGVVVTLDHNNN